MSSSVSSVLPKDCAAEFFFHPSEANVGTKYIKYTRIIEIKEPKGQSTVTFRFEGFVTSNPPRLIAPETNEKFKGPVTRLKLEEVQPYLDRYSESNLIFNANLAHFTDTPIADKPLDLNRIWNLFLRGIPSHFKLLGLNNIQTQMV